MQLILSLILVSVYLISSSNGSCDCGSSGIKCVTPLQYQLCMVVNGNTVPIGQVTTCPAGTICNANTNIPCQVGTLPPTTTTLAPVTAPACSDSSRYPAALCSQYYQCNPFLIFWYSPSLETCPYGQGFDASTSQCVDAALVGCGVSSTTSSISTTSTTSTTAAPTTTTLAPITPPTCSDSSRYPAALCSQYYQCSQFLFWWTSSLETCPSGQGFDASTSECVDAALAGCAVLLPSTTTTSTPRTTITTEPTSTTTTPTTQQRPATTTIAPITAPTCTDSSRYPAALCSQYYQCSSYFIFWWTSSLETCPNGQGFDVSTSACVDATLVVGCAVLLPSTTTTTTLRTTITTEPTSTTTTTTVPTTTTTVPTTTTTTPTAQQRPSTTTKAPITAPACSDASRYPAAVCSQYYQCSQFLIFWYTPSLVTCPSGQGFDASTSECVDAALVGCATTTTTTVPTPIITTTTIPTTTTTVPTTTTITTTVSTPTTTSTTVPTPTTTTTTVPTSTTTTITVPTTTTTVPTTTTTVPTTTTTVPTTTTITTKVSAPTTTSTTVPTPTTTTTTVPISITTTPAALVRPVTTTKAPVTAPACSDASRYPAALCSQYYQCSQFLVFWYTPSLETCPSGQGFDASTSACVDAALVGCVN